VSRQAHLLIRRGAARLAEGEEALEDVLASVVSACRFGAQHFSIVGQGRLSGWGINSA
jgi:hypothetical protein